MTSPAISDASEKFLDRPKKSILGAENSSKKARALAQMDNEIDAPSPKKIKSLALVIDAKGRFYSTVTLFVNNEPQPTNNILASNKVELNLGSDQESDKENSTWNVHRQWNCDFTIYFEGHFVRHTGTPDLVLKKRDTKRKLSEASEEFVDLPTKRARIDLEQNLPNNSSPLKKTRQYGKRGCASSPPQAPDFNDDLDSTFKQVGGVKKTTVAGAKGHKKDEMGTVMVKNKVTEKVKVTGVYIPSDFYCIM